MSYKNLKMPIDEAKKLITAAKISFCSDRPELNKEDLLSFIDELTNNPEINIVIKPLYFYGDIIIGLEIDEYNRDKVFVRNFNIDFIE